MSEYDKESLELFTNKTLKLGYSKEQTVTLSAILIEMWLHEAKEL